uniref:Tyr recombinase domain-containing protein n=1 Tax=Clytia hemisphaerica TaxID=252671 RepID=A0A7M6DQE1_9CNID
MIPSILTKSRADATVKTYRNGFEQWSRWTQNYEEVKAIPADPLYVAIYLTCLIQQNDSYNKIKNSFYAISWFHKICNHEDPCKNNIVKCLLEAAKRILSRPKIKKLPLSPYHLIQIVRKNDDTDCVKQLRLVTMFLIGFSGFLRYQELANIRKGDIIFYKHFMRIFIEKSKCDQYRTGKWVLLLELITWEMEFGKG